MKATAICDGRGNGGTGARAAVLYIEDTAVAEKAERMEPTSNILAEHLAIQLAMELARANDITELEILNDSLTPVSHVNGTYRVKEAHLKPIVDKTWRMGLEFEKVSICRVPRQETKAADQLCRLVDRDPYPRCRTGSPIPQTDRTENPFAR